MEQDDKWRALGTNDLIDRDDVAIRRVPDRALKIDFRKRGKQCAVKRLQMATGEPPGRAVAQIFTQRCVNRESRNLLDANGRELKACAGANVKQCPGG